MRLAHGEISGRHIDLENVDDTLESGINATMITDCRALFDAGCKSETAGLGVADRRCSIEILGLRQHFEQPARR